MIPFYKCYILFLIMTFGFSLALKAQEAKITGSVIDSLTRIKIQNLSVSIYKANDKKLTSISLTDKNGKFTVLPKDLNGNFEIRLSHISYQTKKIFIAAAKQLDLGQIIMVRNKNEIEEVVIKPPVTIKGDTIEFNADAFLLDTNAVVEDLFLRLPGLIIWGDDEITYNGKKLSKVLVNNKEFFGGQFKVALQNLPKSAVETVQIYDDRSSLQKKTNPNEQNYQANIQLKEGAEKMLFGQVGLGKGNEKRKEIIGILNFANKKQQATLGYIKNNTNKNIYSIEQLIANTTFKPNDITNDFNSELLFPGIKDQYAIGGKYLYDFVNAGQKKIHQLKGSFFLLDNNLIEFDSTSVVNTLNLTNDLIRKSSTSNNTNPKVSSFEIAYINDKARSNYPGLVQRFNVSSKVNQQKENITSTYREVLYYDNSEVRSEIANTSQQKNNNYIFNLDSKIQKKFSPKQYYPIELELLGTFQFNEHKQNSSRMNDNLVINDAKLISREYEISNDNLLIDYDINLTRINNLFSNSNKYRINAQFSFRSENKDNFQFVEDRFAAGYLSNTDLSIREDIDEKIIRPKIEFWYSIWKKEIPYRSNEEIFLNFNPSFQFSLIKSRSSSALRNINYVNRSVLPFLELGYKFKNVDYQKSIGLKQRMEILNPNMNHLAPLNDNINQYYYYIPNKLLSEVKTTETVAYSSILIKDRIFLGLDFSYRFIRNDLMDSVNYLNGIRNVKYINSSNINSSITGNLNFSLPIKLSDISNITLKLNASGNLIERNSYVNDILYGYKNKSFRNAISLYYQVFDSYKIGVINESYMSGRSYTDNVELNTSFRTIDNSIKVLKNFTKRITFTTDFMNKNVSFTDFSDHFFIWNAGLDFRLLKGNDLSVNASVYDLLGQNKGVTFSDRFNELSSNFQTKLTRYFMIKLVYFPRKFGLK